MSLLLLLPHFLEVGDKEAEGSSEDGIDEYGFFVLAEP